MAVNSSHVKEGGRVSRRLKCIRLLERCRQICQATRRLNSATGRNSTDHKYEPRATRGFTEPHAMGTRLKTPDPPGRAPSVRG
ncbi:hypothetical protein AVEN_93828-1 [Araneus ventricosus]|uniref:Uncharacterized protein n=1 Tax=Araneus ventricosus TaxID=182803 RepID=A0A4Y2AXJ2_ARAVE|nr:hypothetical protein AVEN_93828-1 [Araneus ventricosus]